MKYIKRVFLATIMVPCAIVIATVSAIATWCAVIVCKEDELGKFFERMKSKR